MREFVQTPAVTCRRDTTIQEAARLLHRYNVGSLIVAEDDKALGVITDRDIAVRAVANAMTPTTPVDRVMTHTVTSVREDTDLAEAAETMAAHGVRRLPVVDAAGQPIGVIALDDLTRYIGKELDALTRALAAQVDTSNYAGWTDWDG